MARETSESSSGSSRSSKASRSPRRQRDVRREHRDYSPARRRADDRRRSPREDRRRRRSPDGRRGRSRSRSPQRSRDSNRRRSPHRSARSPAHDKHRKEIKKEIKREIESESERRKESEPRRRQEPTTSAQKGWVDPFAGQTDPEPVQKPERRARQFDPLTGEERIPESTETDEKIQLPSFEVSGKLAADTNTFKGVVIKYNEPPEACLPRLRWRLYPLKNDDVMKPFYMHRQSAYLIGRNRRIADFPVDHPSCSQQHAVLQYRKVPFEKNGVAGNRIIPYIIDLNSSNGTFLNGEKIETQRYYELREKDSLRFGFSSREYVVLNELSTEGGGEDVDVEMDDEEANDIDVEGAEEKLAASANDYF